MAHYFHIFSIFSLLILNPISSGNGKTPAEIISAINSDCLINIDSEFDYFQISTACQKIKKQANVLIRINPNIDPLVHEYNTTGSGKSCKFGVLQPDIIKMAKLISENENLVLKGIHCHLGSTIDKLEPIRKCATRLKKIIEGKSEKGNICASILRQNLCIFTPKFYFF